MRPRQSPKSRLTRRSSRAAMTMRPTAEGTSSVRKSTGGLSPLRAAARPRHQLTTTVRTRRRHRIAARRAKCALVTADACGGLMRHSHAALLAMFPHLQRHGVPRRMSFPGSAYTRLLPITCQVPSIAMAADLWTRARFWCIGEELMNFEFSDDQRVLRDHIRRHRAGALQRVLRRAWARSTEAPELPVAAAAAWVSATEAFFHAAKENIQTHGGMGFTWELDCHMYYRRAKLLALGSAQRWKHELIGRIERAAGRGRSPRARFRRGPCPRSRHRARGQTGDRQRGGARAAGRLVRAQPGSPVHPAFAP